MRILQIFIFSLVLLIRKFSCQNSDCNTFWRYISGDEKSTQGLITLYPKLTMQQHELRITLTVSTKLPTKYIGDVSLVKDTQTVVNEIANRGPIHYRVRFPVQDPLPKLTAIYYNNELLCSEQVPQQTYGYWTTIQLHHTLYTNIPTQPQQQINNRSYEYQRPQNPSYYQQISNRHPSEYQRPSSYRPEYTQQPDYNPQPVQTQAPVPRILSTNPPVTRYNFNYQRIGGLNSQCGIPRTRQPDSTGLVVYGHTAIKGQFPWLAAFYHSTHEDYEGLFVCGGSLVSTKIVVTAAHCIQNKRTPILRKAEECFFYFGKHDIKQQNLERGVILSGVSQFFMHQSYDAYAETFDGDIAIAVLQRKITFTNFIQPICIWTQSSSYHDIVNRYGVVAGWGRTETTISASDRPRWVSLPVVDDSTCLRSNGGFIKITSNRTFCVGSRDGRSPCNGDSGGGFIVRYGNKWYLRGIVSSSLYDRELQMCDTRNYAVFTDVAQFQDFIMQNIERYG